MGMSQTIYVMTGIRLKRDELKIDIYDEKHLPYTEGDPDVDINIVTDSSTEYVHIGKVILGNSCGSYIDVDETFEIPSRHGLAIELCDLLEMEVFHNDIENWIFTIWI